MITDYKVYLYAKLPTLSCTALELASITVTPTQVTNTNGSTNTWSHDTTTNGTTDTSSQDTTTPEPTLGSSTNPIHCNSHQSHRHHGHCHRLLCVPCCNCYSPHCHLYAYGSTRGLAERSKDLNQPQPIRVRWVILGKKKEDPLALPGPST